MNTDENLNPRTLDARTPHRLPAAHREERIRRHVNDTAALLAYRHGLDVPLGLVRELTAYFTAVEDEPQPNPDNEPGFPATWEVRPRG